MASSYDAMHKAISSQCIPSAKCTKGTVMVEHAYHDQVIYMCPCGHRVVKTYMELIALPLLDQLVFDCPQLERLLHER